MIDITHFNLDDMITASGYFEEATINKIVSGNLWIFLWNDKYNDNKPVAYVRPHFGSDKAIKVQRILYAGYLVDNKLTNQLMELEIQLNSWVNALKKNIEYHKEKTIPFTLPTAEINTVNESKEVAYKNNYPGDRINWTSIRNILKEWEGTVDATNLDLAIAVWKGKEKNPHTKEYIEAVVKIPKDSLWQDSVQIQIPDNCKIVSEPETIEELKKILNEPTQQRRKTAGFKIGDEIKLRLDLVPASSSKAIAKALMFGLQKGYPQRNWEQGMLWVRVFAAAMRHFNSWINGEDCAEDSKLNHLYHGHCCIAFIIEYMERGLIDLDNRKELFEEFENAMKGIIGDE